MIQLGRPVPILRIFDLHKATEFYVGYLGFTVDWQHRFAEHLPVYLQVSRGVCVLHLSEHHGDSTPGARVIIPVVDIDALHGELAGKAYAHLDPGVERTPWGTRELQVTDPFGNRLTFAEQSTGS